MRGIPNRAAPLDSRSHVQDENRMNSTGQPFQLHGFDVSLFTAKARVAMRYKQIFMEEKRADIRMILLHENLLGARTSLADCALMGPVYGHFYTDLVSRRRLLGTAIPVVRWIEFCNMPGADDQGDWFAEDGVPDSLRSILTVMGQAAAPIQLAMVEGVEAWADENAKVGETPPRTVGTAKASLGGTEISRDSQCYSLFMLQRVLDLYNALDKDERCYIDGTLAGTGWEPVLAYHPRHRLEKRGFNLAFA